MNKSLKKEDVYPNLFHYSIDGCDNVFPNFSGLIKNGFHQLLDLNKEYSEFLLFFHEDIEYSPNSHIFIKEFDTYKIMLIICTIENKHYIYSKILLDNDNNVVKNLYDDKPSIVIFSRSFISSLHNETVLCGYISFYKNFYAYVEIENFDIHSNKYIFYFKSFNNNLIASAVYNDTNLKNVSNRNCNFYLFGKQYDLSLFNSFEHDFENKSFMDIVKHISCMDDETKKLFEMCLM